MDVNESIEQFKQGLGRATVRLFTYGSVAYQAEVVPLKAIDRLYVEHLEVGDKYQVVVEIGAKNYYPLWPNKPVDSNTADWVGTQLRQAWEAALSPASWVRTGPGSAVNLAHFHFLTYEEDGNNALLVAHKDGQKFTVAEVARDHWSIEAKLQEILGKL